MEDRYNVECCDFIHAHEELVEKVRRELPGEDTLYDLTELFRIFGDSTRIRILYVLFESEMCVCDIAQLLNCLLYTSPAGRALSYSAAWRLCRTASRGPPR